MTDDPAVPVTAATTPCGGVCAAHRPAVTVTRRTALGVGVTAGVAVLAACGGGSDTTSPPTSAAATGTTLAQVADIPSGGSLVAVVDKVPYGLARKTDGTVVLHSGICTHQRCAVQAAGAAFRCDCHGSQYDAFTGAVLAGPATNPLAPIDFQEKDGAVVLT